MRLLNARSLRLKEFFDDDEVPDYAILSHTWGDEEVSLQDMKSLDAEQLRKKAGFDKIRNFCITARRRGWAWVWIDTCCIDKTNSAELSEAINSMFRWYRNSKACFVYLSDVDIPLRPNGDLIQFTKSRWFTRGWTLQELLAPKNVRFFNNAWVGIGSKGQLSKAISTATGIEEEYLENPDALFNTSIAQRMSWAAGRKTSKKEDMAYCLMGILDVNMPVIYGEGARAFRRLQEEIMRTTYDHSILAWGCGAQELSNGLLAPTPDSFRSWKSYQNCYKEGSHYIMTNLGLHIELPVIFLDDNAGTALGILDCGKNYKNHVILPLEYKKGGQDGPLTMHRARATAPFYADAIPVHPDETLPSHIVEAVTTPSSSSSSSEPVSPASADPLSPAPSLFSPTTTAPSSVNHDFPTDQSYPRRVPVYLQIGKMTTNKTSPTTKLSIKCPNLVENGYYLADCYPPCDMKMSGPTLSIIDNHNHNHNRQHLVRFCEPGGESVLLLLLLISRVGGDDDDMELQVQMARTYSELNSWQMVLYPDYKRVDFARLKRDFEWEGLKTVRGAKEAFYEIM
ncbi:HET-domain-containing protein [Poronia punctata]|nr:HET-domain-containing protein [Poronia punctata]